MSAAVFPSLPGLEWNVTKTPNFKTIIQTAVSGREVRAALQTLPTWHYKMSYEFLRDGVDGAEELKTLLGFFLQRRGAFESFLFDDPADNAITGQELGVGDGETQDYQLVRTCGGFIEPVYDPKDSPAPKIYLDEAEQESGWTLSAAGLLHFDAPPANGAVLTGDYGYYWRVRFKEDAAEFENFCYKLWSLKKLELVSLKP